MNIKKGVAVLACASSVLLVGCTDQERLEQLEKENADYKRQNLNLQVQMRTASEYKNRLIDLEQTNNLLRAELDTMKAAAEAKAAKKTTTAKTTPKKKATSKKRKTSA